MFTEVLKITPKLDTQDLNKMQRTLQGRFKKIAKGFGKGLLTALKGGALAGLAVGLITKILNPLKEVQEAIDRSLTSSDDIATNAKQFNTTSGKLFKLITLARASGLDQSSLFMLISKFQNAVARANLDPSDTTASSVANYTGQKDTSEAFFGFIQQLQKMDSNQRVLVQQQIFGEKQILKMADFLQQDYSQLAKDTGLDKVNSNKLANSIEKIAAMSDLRDTLAARRELGDVQNKAGSINSGMIRNMDKNDQIALERENLKIKSYNDLAALSNIGDKMLIKFDEGILLISGFIGKITPAIEKAVAFFDTAISSPISRGIRSLFGGKGD